MKLCLGKKVEFHETDESDVRKLHFGEYGVHCENGFWIISKAFDKRESGRIRPISKERVEKSTWMNISEQKDVNTKESWEDTGKFDGAL